MIEIVPVMLFILGWHPDRPGDISFERPAVMFTSVAECEEAGIKMAARMSEAATGKSGARYEHRCMPIPSRGEFDELFGQLKNKKP